ncbi:Putative ankyrin repeat protein [Papilio machaon]|uniref:Putative ankyrin repeat protein n=1 Tax=Papilio machaon TaxID=76193 RepID=A0A194RHY2_PAPMA|nr:Putative ankyrin repeat protein [Papilio machaon]
MPFLHAKNNEGLHIFKRKIRNRNLDPAVARTAYRARSGVGRSAKNHYKRPSSKTYHKSLYFHLAVYRATQAVQLVYQSVDIFYDFIVSGLAMRSIISSVVSHIFVPTGEHKVRFMLFTCVLLFRVNALVIDLENLSSKIFSNKSLGPPVYSNSMEIKNYAWFILSQYSRTVALAWDGLYGHTSTNLGKVPDVDVKQGKMPSEVISGKSLQRELADSIIRMVPLDEIRILLACGAKVNEPVTQGLRPLHYAIWQRHLEATRLLLVRGGDVNARDDCGYSALHLAAEHGYITSIDCPTTGLYLFQTPSAVFRARGIEAVLLLISYGADVNAMADARNDYRTVMHYAVLSGNPDMVNLLIKQGGRVNYEGVELNKPSALDLAILKGDVAMVQMLMSAGAHVNASSSVIGSPLHVACSDNIDNRKEIVKLLLESGADPNLKVLNEEDGAQLRPALAEYLASNVEPSAAIVSLLLRYGARVIMKTQFRDPDGILNHLQNVTSEQSEHIFYLLLEAAESFDLCMIKRNSTLTAVQKQALIDRAKNPITLLAQTRIFLRKYFGTDLVDIVKTLEIPDILHQYLLFECR